MEYAHPYARIICLGVPLGIFAAGMSYFIRADGSPTYAGIVLLSGAGLNMILDPIFLFGLDMGISGIAAATVLGQLLSTVLALLYLLRKFKSVSLSAACMKLRLSISGIIFKLGMATFTTHVLITASQIIQMNALRTYGALSVFGSEVVISASGVVSKLTIVLLSSVIGIAMGCQPIWGYNLGNKKFHRVKQTYLLAIRYGSYVALASFLLLQLFPQQILSMFGSEDPLFYEFSTRYIRIFFMMLFLNALQPITSMFCTAIGKAGLGVWMAVFRHGLLLISLLLILPPIMGIDGVLFAGCISDAGAALMVVFIGYYQVKRLNKLEQENTNQAVADTTA